MAKCLKIGENVREEGRKFRGGESCYKKIANITNASPNESIKEVSSKFDNRKVFKNKWKCLGEGGNFEKTNVNVRNAIPKLSFKQIRQLESVLLNSA